MWLRRLACCSCFVGPLGHAADAAWTDGKNKIQQLQRLKENAHSVLRGAKTQATRPSGIHFADAASDPASANKALQIEPTDVEARVWLGEWLSRPELGPNGACASGQKELQRPSRRRRGKLGFSKSRRSLASCCPTWAGFTEAVMEYDRALRAFAR